MKYTLQKPTKPEVMLFVAMLGIMVMIMGFSGNYIAVKTNGCKMPVKVNYNLGLNYPDHFSYSSIDEVENWILTDIIHMKNSIWSFGDVTMILGLLIFIIAIILYYIFKLRKKIPEKPHQ